MELEREILETDIAIVGAGPAGLALAYHLAQLVSADDSVEMPEILILEKGGYVGSHSLSGAVMDPRGLAELIPDYKDRGAPLEAEVSSDSLYFLSEERSIKVPYTPPSLRNHGNYIVSLNKLTGWLAEQVEAKGLDIFAGLAASDLIIDSGRVTGVQTVDMGLDKEGKPKSNFEPGSIVQAKVTVLCEGVRGSLTRSAQEAIPELTSGRLPQIYLTGIKEVWEVPSGRLKPGDVIHTLGWPQPSSEYGGGWLYAMSETMVSVGYAVGLNSPNPANDPHAKFQMYKTHPIIKEILQGGTMLHYGAKAIPDGGYYCMPKLYHEGLLLCGDSAGFLNPLKLKGIHLGIKSGMMAAETIFEALKKDDYSLETLSAYETKFENSWAKEELYHSRNFHASFKGGLIPGLFHAAIQTLTNGKGLFERRENRPDHESMLRIREYRQRFGLEPERPVVKFDNEYLFDKLSDVYKSGTQHEEEQPSHLVVSDYDVCHTTCAEEFGNPCQYFCPAQVYEMVDDDNQPHGKRLQLTPSNCVHCKTCDIADPYQIIRWVTPQGGEGPNYTNM